MAKRLRYEIVALNTAPVPDGIFDRFSSAQKELRKGFRTLSEENAEMFRNEARKQGLEFTHTVKFCDKDVALKEISKQFGDVEFVISDTEEEQAVSRPEAAERPEQAIYVYSVL
jgi:hypothetical protein